MMEFKKKVLLINDIPAEVEALCTIIASSCELIIARDATTGLRIAEESDIDLILLDTIMPDVTCVEIYDSLKSCEKTKDIPLIYVVGSTFMDRF